MEKIKIYKFSSHLPTLFVDYQTLSKMTSVLKQVAENKLQLIRMPLGIKGTKRRGNELLLPNKTMVLT
jgi:hypothetical protein